MDDTFILTQGVKHILGIYYLANEAERMLGSEWYPTATKFCMRIALSANVEVIKVAGVLAALSPRNRWLRNMADTEAMAHAYVVGGATAAGQVTVCTWGRNKRKAIEILECKEPDDFTIIDILNGPKTIAFYQSIMGHKDNPCIDGHAYGIWLGHRVALDKVPKLGVKLLATIKEDYATAARMTLTNPRDLQAITWLTWRRIHNIHQEEEYG